MERISVIVPIYNIKACLGRCIESILGQTYTNLEIILVDDGSTDGSGELCDTYAMKDQRIRVIHKPNGGISDARNVGIDQSTGTCLLTIDGDDYVAPWHIQHMYDVMQEQGAELVCCSFVRTLDRDYPFVPGKEGFQVYTPMQAVYAMLYSRRLFHSAWGKLYRRELFDGVRYPKGKLYEDLAATYHLVVRTNKVIALEDCSYAYFQREGSIVRGSITQKNAVAFDHLVQLQAFLPQTKKVSQAIACHYVNLCLEFLRNPDCDRAVQQLCHRHLCQNRSQVVGNPAAPLRIRAFSLLSYLGPERGAGIFRLYDRWRYNLRKGY